MNGDRPFVGCEHNLVLAYVPCLNERTASGAVCLCGKTERHLPTIDCRVVVFDPPCWHGTYGGCEDCDATP